MLHGSYVSLKCISNSKSLEQYQNPQKLYYQKTYSSLELSVASFRSPGIQLSYTFRHVCVWNRFSHRDIFPLSSSFIKVALHSHKWRNWTERGKITASNEANSILFNFPSEIRVGLLINLRALCLTVCGSSVVRPMMHSRGPLCRISNWACTFNNATWRKRHPNHALFTGVNENAQRMSLRDRKKGLFFNLPGGNTVRNTARVYLIQSLMSTCVCLVCE